MDLRLAGHTALVTGASIGIGRGIAETLAGEGVDLIVVARREAPLRSLAAELSTAGISATVMAADLREADDVERVARDAMAEHGHVDILVNNAGVSLPLSVGAAQASWDEAFGLQFRAVRLLAERLLPPMRAERWGRIVNIGGTLEPPDRVNGSTIAKAAMVAWAKGLSREVGRDGVTVNTVIPGRIMSGQITERLHRSPEEREAFARANIPVGYFGEPTDVGRLVAYLASPLARYITGEVIHVDGGMRRYAF